MERIDIIKNDGERLRLVVGDMSFLFIHETYPDGMTFVLALPPWAARDLNSALSKHLPGVERRAGLTT